MAKVLISFLGVGSFEDKEKRIYRTAEYHLGKEPLEKCSFIAAALSDYYKVDEIIILGTVHSMWEEVYRWFGEKKDSISEEIYMEISDACKNADYKSDLSIRHKTEIEEALGKNSHVIPIKYGITEDEIQENINIILKLEDYLRKGDELIVDITHSFRSLPLFIMNLLIYLQNVSRLNVKISHIHYGMLDVYNELKFVPIVDLISVLKINEWISGAYAFENFGNAYKISELVKSENRQVAEILNRFSDLMNLNYLSGIQNQNRFLSSIKNEKYETLMPQLIITPIIENFIKKFRFSEKQQYRFQFNVAQWQLEHKNYAASYISLTESIITYICEKNDMDWDKKDNRDKAKYELGRNESAQSNLKFDLKLVDTYNKIKDVRNCIAHTIEKDYNYSKMISILKESINDVRSIIS